MSRVSLSFSCKKREFFLDASKVKDISLFVEMTFFQITTILPL
jgi:hypothetical protein